MSKKIIVFAILFSLTLSMMITQEASALIRGSGQTSHTTASLELSKVCGIRICEPGENSKWSYIILTSQREGYDKATGGHYGNIIMHQLVVNSLIKNSQVNSVITTSHIKSIMTNINSTGSK
jgi:hypothetical protein